MFGSNTFSFGQPQQQQQQQQPAQSGGLFGQTTGFGQQQQQAPAFGQPQQPAQTGFGGFGGASTTPAFGSTQPSTSTFGQPAQSGGLFGQQAQQQPQQSTFSFGGNNATSTFGQPAQNNTTSLFGAPKPATTGFGGFGAPAQPAQTGGLFGQPAAGASAFGAAPAVNGTTIPYQATTLKDPPSDADPSKGKPQTNAASQTDHHYQSISVMPQYEKFSVEELRVQDYQAGRKGPTAGASTSFGGFGQPQQPAATGFGAPAASGGLFGAPATSAPAFGSAAPATGAFGAPAPATGGGLFGTSAPASNPFGQPAQPATGAFGQPAQPAATGGLFGSTTGAFGQPAQQQQPATTGFGGFGAAAAKPAGTGFSFGAAAPASAPAPTSGLFGSAAPAASNPFGQPASAAPAAGGLFGAAATPAAPAAGGFSFGGASAAPAAKPLFGSTPATSSPFGASTAAKPAFSFGGAAAPAAGGGLFGQPAAQPAASAPAFGAAPAATTGFGAPATSTFGQPAAPATTGFGAGGLFGAAKPATSAPATGGLFGSAPAAGGLGGGSLFGQPQQAQPAQTGGLFGNSTLGGGFGGGLSTASQQPQQPQQVQYASADDANAYGSNPLFASTAPAATAAAAAAEKKKAPIYTAFRGTPVKASSTKITRLRGFGMASSAASPGPAGSPLNLSLGGSTPGSAGRGSPLRLVNGLGEEALSPAAFVARPSVKKLVISKDSVPQFGYAKGATPGKNGAAADEAGAAAARGKVAFNPEVKVPSSVARGLLQQGSGATNGLNDSTYSIGTPIKKSGGNIGSLGDLDTPAPLDVPASAAPARRATPAPAALQHGDYYVTPSIEELQKLPPAKLRRVPDLVVGRVGFGEIKFTQPVDLTTLPALEDLLGGVVLFEDRYCTVYPPEFEDVKPAPGGGLNVPAVIELERCWPLDKATRQPIKDEANPKLVQHVRKLKGLADTEFIEFEAEKGRWTFRVEAF